MVRLGASGWTDVGDRVGDGYDRFAPQMYSLQFDSKGVGYVAFYSYAVSPALKIYTYNGASWLPMKLDKDSASYTYFKLSAKDTPYVFYNTFAEGTVIKKFDGTQWVRVKEVGTNNIEPYWGMFQFGKNDTLYSAGKDATGKFGVAKYDGLNWNVLADTLISTNMLSRVSFALDRNDKPHFAYGDINTGKATVIKCDNGVWSVLGMPSFSSDFMGFPSLAFDTSNVPYLAYANNHISQHNGSATVSKFDGVNWVNVGDTAFSDGQSLCSDIVFNRNNTPYVAYRDVVNNENVTVMKYLSGRWMTVGAEGFSHGNGDSYDAISLKIADNNTPYVGYVYVDTITDEAFVSVMKYGCPVQPQADICAVYTDTVTNKNIITWDGSTLPAIDSFRIYREDNGIYQYLGGVARDKYLFTDATAKPDVQSYRYKLVLVDNCEQEADTSSLNAHKSIQLTFNYLLQGIASVRWNTYEGRSNLIYTIKRSNNGAAFADLASFSIAGHDTTYLDVNPPSGSNEYR